jgi:hypothetical protein
MNWWQRIGRYPSFAQRTIVSDMFGTFASLSDSLDSPLLLQVLH